VLTLLMGTSCFGDRTLTWIGIFNNGRIYGICNLNDSGVFRVLMTEAHLVNDRVLMIYIKLDRIYPL